MPPVFRLAFLDNDSERREIFAKYFSSHGFEVSEYDNRSAMVTALNAGHHDLLLIHSSRETNDVALLADIRTIQGLRCIIITDRSELIDRVIALELGADDYLSVTTDKREILARVRVALRRKAREASPPTLASGDAPDQIGIRFDRLQRRLLHSDGAITPLTTAEFNLLVSLADNINVSLTREKLYELVYNRRWSALDRTLDTLVAKLRRKLELDPQHPTLIKTVHGTGYIFTGANFA